MLSAALCVAILLALIVAPSAQAANNGLAATPPMGWNSWNHYACSGLNQTVIQQIATAMANSGLKSAGYEYINLDDCWMATSRNSNGNLVPDSGKFPGGMPALVSYVHNLGLKIGLYEDVGTKTCQGRPGSYGYYQQDANTFASWGIDYIKMDWCNTNNLTPQTQYTQFGQALASAGGKIVYSLCEWGTDTPWNWAPSVGNLWRTTSDISDNWLVMVNNMEANSAYAASTGPGAWNDADMLEVGNGGMTDTEYQTHFSMWAMMSAPLIAGNNLTSMSSATLATLTNSEVIAVDQDALGHQGILIFDNGSGLQVWAKQITGATVAALLNLSGSSANITANWSDIGLQPSQSAAVSDLWAHSNLGTFSGSFTANVASHGVSMVSIAATGSQPAQTIYEADASVNTLSGQTASSIQQCACLDGNQVGYIGDNASNYVTINNVNAAASGSYYMTVYGSIDGTRTFYVSVNGGAASQVTLTGTSNTLPATTGMIVQLNAGSNNIKFFNNSAYAPNLDHIVISPVGGTASSTPNFALGAAPTSLTVVRGNNGTSTITVTSQDSFNSAVVLTSTGLPSGVTASLSSSSVTPPSNGSTTSTLTLTASSTAATENSTVTVTGTSGSLKQSTAIALTVSMTAPTATPTPTSSCTPTAITPYIQVSGGSWLQTASVTVSAGSSVNLGPQPVSGGSWSWTGPSGYTSTSRQIAVTVNSTSTYTATYTNSCGSKPGFPFYHRG